MAQAEFLARDFKFEINTTGTTYVEIRGLDSWEWKESPVEAEATDFNDNGYSSSLIVGNKMTISLKGHFNTDGDTRDPGQAAVEDSARTFGAGGLKTYRISAPRNAATFGDADGSIQFTASAKLMGVGGGQADLLSWGVELVVDGAPTYAGFFA